MRNLYEYAQVCMVELDSIGVPYRKSTFVVNSRAVRRWGCCSSNGDGTFTIQISDVLLNEQSSVDGLKNTIIHELLHTCVGCLNHGKKWQEYADIVNNHFGYCIKRADSCSEKGVSQNMVYENKRHYEVTCNECKAKFIYYRDNKVTKNTSHFRCSCGGKLTSVLIEKDGSRFITCEIWR